MPEQFHPDKAYLSKERLAYRYQRALARGDIETIATILQFASNDAELERMLYAMHDLEQTADVYQSHVSENRIEQNNDPSLAFLMRPISRPAPSTSHGRRIYRSLQMAAAMLVVLALIVGSLALFHSLHIAHITGGKNTLPSVAKTVVTPQGMVVMLLTNGEVQAVRGVTGQLAWNYATGQQAPDDYNPTIYRGLVIQSQVVYVLARTHVYALNENNGQLVWQKNFSVQPSNTDPNLSQMAVDDGLVYVSLQADPQSVLYVLRARDGQTLWQVKSGDLAPPLLAASNGIAYIAIQNTTTYQTTMEAVDGLDGRMLWSYHTPGSISFATVVQGVLYVYAFPGDTPSGDGKLDKRLLAFKTSNGHIIWFRDVHYGNYTIPIVSAQGTLVIDDNQQLCVHSARDGSLLWCTPQPSADHSTTVQIESYLAGPDKLYVMYLTEHILSSMPVPCKSHQTCTSPGQTFSQQVQYSLQVKALNYQSGQSLWSTNTLAYDWRYSLFALGLVQLQQDTLLVSNSSPLLTGFNADNGRILWHLNGSFPPEILQIVATA